jgi:SNF2 family DNA or RNA helicase
MEKILLKIADVRAGIKPIAVDSEDFGLVNIGLREYQRDGIKWLIERHNSQIGCILADEMGLGKTCQTIGLILHVLKSSRRAKVLVIAPLSVVSNWSAEFSRFAPSVNLLVYKGDKESRVGLQDKIRDDDTLEVILTSYDLVLRDDYVFNSIQWTLLVGDEGHRLKNACTSLYACLDCFRIAHRVLLTGTPIQNNLDELYALLSFIQPVIFKARHKAPFIETYSNRDANLAELTRVLQPFILRRMKAQVNISLPNKLEVVLYHGLTPLQKRLYKAVLVKDRSVFSDAKKVRLTNVVMQLRKICSHPYLLNGVEPEPFVLGEHLVETSDKFMLLDNLLGYLHSNNHKVLLFSQFTLVLDMVQDYLQLRGYSYERLDGSVRGEGILRLVNGST